MSLRSFFLEYYVPVVMAEPSVAAQRGYLCALRRWEELTDNPPLEEITAATLAQFKQALVEAPKYRGGEPISQNYRRKTLDYVQWILDQAGPRGVRSTRTAAGLLREVPWTKPPRRQTRRKPPTGIDRIVAFYRVVDSARWPQIDGITPAAWWRAVTSTMLSTSLRIGQVVRLPYDAVNWSATAPQLVVPARINGKSRADETKPLHPVALRDLLAVRGTRELLLPAFPKPHSASTIYREFHRLEKLAGFEPIDGVAFHGARRRALTELARISPTAAQQAAGHASFQTTIAHYVSDEVLADAVQSLDLMDKLA